MAGPNAHAHIHNAVPGALSHYDLPDLERLAGAGRVSWVEGRRGATRESGVLP